MLRRFARNTAGRDLLVGDLHGHLGKFRANLAAIGFDPARDRVFCCGDMVDRGPDSAEVLGLLAEPWFRAIRGNHETMGLLWARHGSGGVDTGMFAINGGGWMIGMTPAERLPYADAFEALPVAIELETDAGLVGLVHAECPLADWAELRRALTDEALPAAQLTPLVDTLLWGRGRADSLDCSEVAGVLAVVVGHTPVERVTSLGNTVYIDTGAWLPRNHAKPFVFLDAATLSPVYPPAAALPA